ncbi:MAG: translation initiation factor IF-6 [Candidatus Micrarchaeia archaeon]
MKGAQLTFGGNDFVGIFLKTNDSFTLAPTTLSKKNEEIIKKTLETKIVKISISNSELIGLFSVMNNNGLLISPLSYNEEVKKLKEVFDVVEVFETEFVAIGNNIASNDKIAIISPVFSKKEEKIIQDVLNVETIKLRIAKHLTPGANIILTNKGAFVNQNLTQEEEEKLKEIGINFLGGTLNFGTPYVGICGIANKNGYCVGLSSTGIELNRIERAIF